LVAITTASAFAGAFLGAKLIKKITLTFIQAIVAVMMIIISSGMIIGLI
jgi:uncharacterized membrane protein YfcA